MSHEELKLVVTMAFKVLIASRAIKPPITSMDLLTSVMTTKLPQGLLPNSETPKFRLTDLARFESILEDLSNTWSEGTINFSRDASSKMMIWELASSQTVGSSGHPLLGAGHQSAGTSDLLGLNSRKRKRIIDEDADSAAGDDDTSLEEEDAIAASSSTLANLNAEMREVYTILQTSTAKGRLLAEQVGPFYSPRRVFLFLKVSALVSLARRKL